MHAKREAVVGDLVRVITASKWAAKATITEVVEEQFPPPAYPFPITYQIRGNITTKEAIAYGCFPPDRVQSMLADVQDGYDEEEYQITSYLDFMIQANYSIQVYSFLESDANRPLLFVKQVPNLIICFTSFDVETGPVLEALQLPHELSGVRITGLLLDEEKPTKATKQFVSRVVQNRFPCFWVGENGWDSEAVQLLCVEESAPSAFLFDANGFCESSGGVDDCIEAYLIKTLLDKEESKAGGNGAVVADLNAWQEVKQLVPKFQLGAKWKTTRVVFPKDQSPPSQVIQISGPVYEEQEAQVRASALSRFDCHRVQVVTHADPLRITSTCHTCTQQQSSKYVCLVCNLSLCPTCAKAHNKTDPLVILSHGDLSRAILGVGHVIKDAEQIIGTGDNHPDIGCDCCLVALAGEVTRFKNLAKMEHDLCQGCFLALIKASNGKEVDEEDIDDRFNCHPQDPFCEIKCSRGVAFNRIHGNKTTTRINPKVPQGHTAFSWTTSIGIPELTLPQGHTNFSWGRMH
ncbi:hypothetical protein BASA81_001264 [Batrachochytrium salamandrivorans]|nr:hypothetical protein BASA81_001264 [Batrachochytrium salamandrivorans]